MASIVNGIIEQIKVDNNNASAIASTAYGVCDTGADTAAKVVEITGFKLITGVTIHVKFTNANSASNPTLQIKYGSASSDVTTAKAIVLYDNTAAGIIESTTGWNDNAILSLTYDGTYWVRNQSYIVEPSKNTAKFLRGDGDWVTLPVASDSVAGITLVGASGGAAAYSHTHSDLASSTHVHGHITNSGVADDNNITTGATVTTSDRFLREDGTWTVPAYGAGTDEATKQSPITDTTSTEYNILLKNSTGDSQETAGVKFANNTNKQVTVNPSTGAITAPGGFIGEASSASSVDWTNVQNTPTTLLDYGITDAMDGSTIVNKVKTTAASDDTEYKVLMSAGGSSLTSGNDYEAVYDTEITINPSTSTITASRFEGSVIYYVNFTIASGKTGVRLPNAAFTAQSYVLQIVVDSGETYLTNPISWSSTAGNIELSRTTAEPGAVSGYIIVACGTPLTITSPIDLPESIQE